jgi:hypothetical protein
MIIIFYDAKKPHPPIELTPRRVTPKDIAIAECVLYIVGNACFIIKHREVVPRHRPASLNEIWHDNCICLTL